MQILIDINKYILQIDNNNHVNMIAKEAIDDRQSPSHLYYASFCNKTGIINTYTCTQYNMRSKSNDRKIICLMLKYLNRGRKYAHRICNALAVSASFTVILSVFLLYNVPVSLEYLSLLAKCLKENGSFVNCDFY
jgi:hypothetical protein